MLRALMEIRAPCPDRYHGLEGPAVDRFARRRSDRFAHHRQDDLRDHGEAYFSLAAFTFTFDLPPIALPPAVYWRLQERLAAPWASFLRACSIVRPGSLWLAVRYLAVFWLMVRS
jgi:hypothetical protein